MKRYKFVIACSLFSVQFRVNYLIELMKEKGFIRIQLSSSRGEMGEGERGKWIVIFYKEEGYKL